MPRRRPPINSQVLEWAVSESALSAEEIGARLDVPTETVSAWVAGDELPSQGQFTALVKMLRRPASIFFLSSPPESSGMPPSLRRAVGRTERELTAAELREVRRAKRIQRLVSSLELAESPSPPQIPSIASGVSPEDAGAMIRAWLDISLEEQFDWQSPRQAFNAWRDAAESRRILVMQLRLGSGGLRGFSFSDQYAPLVAVNTAENLQARIFTLVHELAHLSSATGTACLEGVNATELDGSIERWCDRVASAAILPRQALRVAFRQIVGDDEPSFDVVRKLADRFTVSLRATAVALVQLGLADSTLYDDVEEAAPTSDYEKGFGRGGGLRAPQQRLGEVGPRAASVVLEALWSDRLTERDARQYLRLDGAELSELTTALGDSNE